MNVNKRIGSIICINLAVAFNKIAHEIEQIGEVKCVLPTEKELEKETPKPEKTIEDERESKKETTSIKEEKEENRPTMDELRKLAGKVAKKHGPGIVFEILETFGASKIVSLNFGDFNKVQKILNETLGE